MPSAGADSHIPAMDGFTITAKTSYDIHMPGNKAIHVSDLCIQTVDEKTFLKMDMNNWSIKKFVSIVLGGEVALPTCKSDGVIELQRQRNRQQEEEMSMFKDSNQGKGAALFAEDSDDDDNEVVDEPVKKKQKHAVRMLWGLRFKAKTVSSIMKLEQLDITVLKTTQHNEAVWVLAQPHDLNVAIKTMMSGKVS